MAPAMPPAEHRHQPGLSREISARQDSRDSSFDKKDPFETHVRTGLSKSSLSKSSDQSPDTQTAVQAKGLLPGGDGQPPGIRTNIRDGQVNRATGLAFQGDHPIDFPRRKRLLNL